MCSSGASYQPRKLKRKRLSNTTDELFCYYFELDLARLWAAKRWAMLDVLVAYIEYVLILDDRKVLKIAFLQREGEGVIGDVYGNRY